MRTVSKDLDLSSSESSESSEEKGAEAKSAEIELQSGLQRADSGLTALSAVPTVSTQASSGSESVCDDGYSATGGDKVDFYIHLFSKKRKRQEEKRVVFLQNICGHVEAGTVCAIIGPRDSGKDRLLELLSGRTNKHSCFGEVHMGGESFGAPQMRATTSYLTSVGHSLVPQLTVEESVDFTAKMVLPPDIDEPMRRYRVDRILDEVHLAKVKTSRVDKINAEDRVRVTLAQVLMECKRVIFLDEPTRDLDLLASEKVIRDLIQLAETKKLTVFVSLEHPTKELLYKFQKCLFLSQGRQVYFGRVRHTVDFFSRLGYPIPEETSVYDHVLSLTVASGERTTVGKGGTTQDAEKHLDSLLKKANVVFEDIEMARLNEDEKRQRKSKLEMIRRNHKFIKLESDSYQQYNASWMTQVRVLMGRHWLVFKADFKGAFLYRFILVILWLAFFWCICADDAKSKSFPENFHDLISSMTLAIAGIQLLSMLTMPESVGNARLFQSDMNQNLYRPSAFVVAHLIMNLVLLPVVQSVVAAAYFYTLGLDKASRDAGNRQLVADLLYFGLMQLLLAVTGEVLALAIVLMTNSPSLMYMGGGLIHFMWMILSGGIIRLCDNVPIGVIWLSFTSPAKWVLDGTLRMTLDSRSYKYVMEDADKGIDAQWTGIEVLNDYYCFDNKRMHAPSKTLSFIALGSMLFILVSVAFTAARLVQTGHTRD